MSDAETEEYAFDVTVESRYVPAESDEQGGRYVFAYTITIANAGDRAAQLLARRWLITDGEGRTQEVEGAGVVGRQPRIPPGKAFRYTSGATLETEVGTMEGHYLFQSDEGAEFLVPIAAFTLAVPNALH